MFAEFLSDTAVITTAIGKSVYKPVYGDYNDTNHPAWLDYYGDDCPYYFLEGYHNINRVGSKIVYNPTYNCYEVPDQIFGEHPVANVTWFGAMAFCQWMTEKNFHTELNYEHEYRLPTEAEWEYMAHGVNPGVYPIWFMPYEPMPPGWWNFWQIDWGRTWARAGFSGFTPPYMKYYYNIGNIVIGGEKGDVENIKWWWVIPPGLGPSFPEREIGTVAVGELGTPTSFAFSALIEPFPGGYYDVIGNVWELCYEEYNDRYYQQLCDHIGGDAVPVIDPPNPTMGWTHPDHTESFVWDRILPHNLYDNDPVIYRGGGWGGDDYDDYDANPPFDLGEGFSTKDYANSGRCEMWRVTDRPEMLIRADQGYNKIGFRVMRRADVFVP
jgi:hypothetical protein